jgi:NAD(P)H-nitrite reductase large subunit
MIVCHCHQLTDRDFCDTAKGRAVACAFLVAGTACGGCVPLVEKLRAQALAGELACTSPADKTVDPRFVNSPSRETQSVA